MAHDLLLGKTKRNWSANISGNVDFDDPFIWTPSAVKAELMRVLNVVDTVNLEVSKAASDHIVSNDEWRQWRQFYTLAHDYLTSASPMWGSNVKNARIHEQEANKWRNLVESRGTKPMGPAKQGRHPEDRSWLNSTTAALAIGGAASLALLISAIKK